MDIEAGIAIVFGIDLLSLVDVYLGISYWDETHDRFQHSAAISTDLTVYRRKIGGHEYGEYCAWYLYA